MWSPSSLSTTSNRTKGIVLIGSWWWHEVCGVGDGRERERERERGEKTNRYLHNQW
jgi:hypothetical protein